MRPDGKFLEMSEADFDRVVDTDYKAAYWLARATLPGMLGKGWGRIINFAGMNAIHGYNGRAAVSVAKHAAWGLTKALAKEFGPKGITTNIISPGPIMGEGAGPAHGGPHQADGGARAGRPPRNAGRGGGHGGAAGVRYRRATSTASSCR